MLLRGLFWLVLLQLSGVLLNQLLFPYAAGHDHWIIATDGLVDGARNSARAAVAGS